MSRQIKGLLYFYFTDIRHSLTIFWSILMGILAVSLLLVYVLVGDDGFMTFALTGPMYVYCAVYGFLSAKEFIPYSIKMGATRKNMMVSLAIFFGVISISFSIIGTVIQEGITLLNEVFGINTFMFLHLSYFLTDTMLSRIVIDAFIMMFFFSLMFIVGLLLYKFGLAIGGTVIGAFFLTFIVGLSKGWVAEGVIKLYKGLDMTYFWKLGIISVVIYSLSWLFLRRITIVKAK